MSGSGGFYKYRCKYFYTHNCTNWVYVNNSPCANCLVSFQVHPTIPPRMQRENQLTWRSSLQAEGRDSIEAPPQQQFRDIIVPYFDDNGMRQECLMEFIATDPLGLYWSLRYKAPVQVGPTVTSDTPRPVYPSA